MLMRVEEQAPPTVKRRRWLRWTALSFAAVALVLGVAGWYLTTDSFTQYLRGRIVRSIEESTGGRVELGELRWSFWRGYAEVSDLTIHGLEPDNEAPYVHVDRVYLQFGVTSFLRRHVVLRQLSVERPAVHLLVYPDGSTNQPVPKGRARGGKSAVETLVDVAIRKLELSNGALQVNDRRTPLDLRANDVVASLAYADQPVARYQGRFAAGKIDARFEGYRPFAASVDVDFNLYRNMLDIASLRVASQRSVIEASGQVADLRHPVLALKYKGRVDLQQTAAILRLPQLRSGMANVEGSGNWGEAKLESSGRVAVRDVRWHDALVRLGNIAASANYSIGRERLEISGIKANVAGGTATGTVAITSWTGRPAVAAQAPGQYQLGGRAPSPKPLRGGEIRLVMKDLSVPALAEAFSRDGLPLTELHLTGFVNGSLETEWVGKFSEADTSMSFDAVPPAEQAVPGMPVTAHFEATHQGRTRTLRIREMDLRTSATHVAASGAIGSGAANLRIEAQSSDIHELQPILTANTAKDLPIQIEGQASFSGTLRGKTAFPEIHGQVKVTDFTTVITPSTASAEESQIVAALRRGAKREPAGSQPASTPKPLHFHWDSFTGDVSYGPQYAAVRNGVLRHEKAELKIEGSSTLARGRLAPNSIFDVRIAAHDVALQDVQPLLGLNYPVSGTLRVDFSLTGTRLDPRGAGRLSLKNGSAYGEPVDSLVTDLRFTGQEAQFSNVRLGSREAELAGDGAYNVQTTQFRFNVRGKGLEIARLPGTKVGKLAFSGLAEFDGRGSGTLNQPMISGNARIPDIRINGHRAGELTASAVTKGDTLEILARSKFEEAALTLDGKVQLRDQFPADVTVRMSKLDLQPLLEGVARGHSSIDGTLHARGPLRNPEALSGRLEITRYVSVLEGVRLVNGDPIVASFSNGVASLEAFRLLGEDTDFTASGTAAYTGARQLNLRADGKLNLKLWQGFNTEITSYGTANVGVQVHGTVSEPAMRGRITIAHGGVSYVDLPNGLSDINGTMVFNEDRLQVEQLTARTGGGELKLGGFIVYKRHLSFNLTAAGKDIRIRYPDGVSSNADANLRLAGTLQNSTLSGDIVVNNFSLNPRFDFATYLQRAKQVAEVQDPKSPLNNLHLDVRVTSAPELQLQTALGRITGDVDLRLRGTAYRPGVLGRISIVEGEINFNGTKYRLDRGDVAFTNPTKIEPILDLEASARVSNYDISIGLHGSTDKLNSTYRSDPPLPTADVFALLAFGRTADESAATTTQTTFTQSASNAVLGSALNAAVSNRVQRLFGVSRIKIDPEVGGPENNPNARITVEQQVSNNITLTYITNLTQSSQQVIQFQYNVNRNVSVVGVRDEYGILGFEVQIRQRRK